MGCGFGRCLLGQPRDEVALQVRDLVDGRLDSMLAKPLLRLNDREAFKAARKLRAGCLELALQLMG